MAEPTPAADATVAEPTSALLVELREVSKDFGPLKVLENVTWSPPVGCVSGLLGPNGAGKTTLFRLMMGILKASHGSVRIAGRDAFEQRAECKRLVGYLPDEPMFYSYLTGWEILTLSAGMHGIGEGKMSQLMQPLALRLGLDQALGRYADEYSRGMKKKLGLMLALLHQPAVLILDEPTNGLDVDATRLFFELMQELAEEGRTIIFSTHLMDQVERLCRHVAVLHRGRLLSAGPLDDLRARRPGASLEDLYVELTRG
ncbi:MAG: ABC transporter ATP-binding protein [Verrucomicrobiales bacterium]|nr:ABC transporter ATP-binding protein [Verrucomicrobiales bacterium]